MMTYMVLLTCLESYTVFTNLLAYLGVYAVPCIDRCDT